MIQANKLIRKSGVPNFKGCKIEVPSNFNFEFLETHLQDYNDPDLIKFLKYGFPLGNTLNKGSHRIPKNHKGATMFPQQLEKILTKERDTRAIIGPFDTPTLPGACFSPLNTVEKKGTSERRLILDLSSPENNSINDGIDKEEYLGKYGKLTLPSVDALVEKVMQLGRGCKVFKVDLTRGYRQIKIDSGDVHFLGYVFRGKFYFDIALAMGAASSARCCQMVTSAVVFIYTKFGYFAVNYLDDIGGAEDDQTAERAYDNLLQLLHNVGLQIAPNKCCPPCTIMTFLGVEVNTLKLTLKIPEQKWTEIKLTLLHWAAKETAYLKEVQELAGLLNFACRCVKSGRIYLARILNFLRLFNNNKTPKTVENDVKLDIKWWLTLAPKFNGVSLIQELKLSKPDQIMSSDSCLTGGGSFFEGRFVHWEFPEEIHAMDCNINQLEYLMVVLTVKLWGNQCKRKRILIYCDNENTVLAINSGKSRDLHMQNCLRELHILNTIFSCEIKAEFIAGVTNRKADFLSRWGKGEVYQRAFFEETKGFALKEYFINDSMWEFFIKVLCYNNF